MSAIQVKTCSQQPSTCSAARQCSSCEERLGSQNQLSAHGYTDTPLSAGISSPPATCGNTQRRDWLYSGEVDIGFAGFSGSCVL